MSRLRMAGLLSLSGRSLSQHRGRTLFTLLGVVLGAFLLVVSLSVGQGIRAAITRTLSFRGQLRVIHIYRDHSSNVEDAPEEELGVDGNMSGERRKRIRNHLAELWRDNEGQRPGRPITETVVRELEQWQHVRRVTPHTSMHARLLLDGRTEETRLVGVSPDNEFAENLVFIGEMDQSRDGRSVVIHEFLAYQLGFHSDGQLQSLIGKPVQLQLSGWLSRGVLDLMTIRSRQSDEDGKLTPEAEAELKQALKQLTASVEQLPLDHVRKELLKSTLNPDPDVTDSSDDYHFVEEFTIGGIFRSPSDEELERNWHEYELRAARIIIPIGVARNLSERIPLHERDGYPGARVMADDEAHVAELTERLREEEFLVHSLIDFIEALQTHVAVITYVMSALAAVALLVAAMGISNVMAMSVLERTREIGIMKAVGARERDIRVIFLFEGSFVGMLGGAIGVVLGVLASIPGNTIARWVMLQNGFDEQLDGTLFAYPLWVILGVPVFVALITTFAAYFPARRASRIDPIEALRHD